MKWIRRILCRTNLKHRLQKKWTSLKKSGLCAFSAALYGYESRDGKFSHYRCKDCGKTFTPVEAIRRGWIKE